MLVRTNDFALTTRRLNYDGNRLSGHVDLLRSQFSIILLRHAAQHLDLATTNTTLLPRTRTLMIRIRETHRTLTHLGSSVTKPIHVAIPISLKRAFFSNLLLRFSNGCPSIRVRLSLDGGFHSLSHSNFSLTIHSRINGSRHLITQPLLT